MKKKFRFLSAILTLAMCVGLCVPASASVYNSDEDDYRGVFYWATLYADYESSCRGCTWARSDSNMENIPVSIQARLFYNGSVRKETKMAAATNKLYFVNTDSMAAAGEYYSQGKVQIAGTTLPTYETDRFTISRAMPNLLDTLDENGDYPVNSKGEAYGSAMLASVVGYEPDLISAIGTDGVEGYLRLEDTIANIRTPEEAASYMETYYEDNVLPLYNSEGEVIGTFVEDLNPGISADSMEEMQQKIANGLPTPLQETVVLPQTEEEFSALVAKSMSKWAYPANADGLTYGSPYGEMAVYEPDLIPVITTDGKSGYMRRIDEKKAIYSDSIDTTPVYDLEGNTIGEFTFDAGVTPSSDSDMTAAQARAMRIENIRTRTM